MSAIIDASIALKNPGQVCAFDTDPELEDMDVLGISVCFDNVRAYGEMRGAEERVGIRGDATAQVSSSCARCLSPVTVQLHAQVDALYARQPDPDDPDLYLFEGSKLDLTDAVRDALLLELPYRFLCREDCKGLCPKCGKNLNLGSCTCQQGQSVTNPFSALKSMVQESNIQDD